MQDWLLRGLVDFIEDMLEKAATVTTLSEAAACVDAGTLATLSFVCYQVAKLRGTDPYTTPQQCKCGRTTLRPGYRTCAECHGDWVDARRLEIQNHVNTAFSAELAACRIDDEPV